METTPHVDPAPGKVKKRYRKKKTKLEEVFPSYLQVPLTPAHTYTHSHTFAGNPNVEVLMYFLLLPS